MRLEMSPIVSTTIANNRPGSVAISQRKRFLTLRKIAMPDNGQ